MTGRTVTRADLTDAVYKLELKTRDSVPEQMLSRDDCAGLVEDVLREMMDRLADGEMVKISSFGTFTIRQKNERLGRNPKTGEEAVISPRRVLSFRASQVLKDKLNGAG
jgi:integration host factor subunit alpha